jgi:hypothetical protein
MRASHLLTAALAIAALAAAPASALASSVGVSTTTPSGPAALIFAPLDLTSALAARKASAPSIMTQCKRAAVRVAGRKASCTWEKLANEPDATPCYILRAWSPKWKQWFGGAWTTSVPCYAPLKKKPLAKTAGAASLSILAVLAPITRTAVNSHKSHRPLTIMQRCVAFATHEAGPGSVCTCEQLAPVPGLTTCYVLRAYSPRWKQWFGGEWRTIGNPKNPSVVCYSPLKKKPLTKTAAAASLSPLAVPAP